MSSRGRSRQNAAKRAQNTPEVIAFCEDNDIKWEYVHGQTWQIRLEGIMDVYPTNKKICKVKTGEWGAYSDYEELGTIFAEYLQELDERGY